MIQSVSGASRFCVENRTTERTCMPDEKPYYRASRSSPLRCKACHKYWPDKCECVKKPAATLLETVFRDKEIRAQLR